MAQLGSKKWQRAGKFLSILAVLAISVVFFAGTSMALTDHLLWQNQSSGRIAYWKLNSTGKLKNTTENDGWAYVGGTLTLSSAWSLGGILVNIAGSGNDGLVWHNQSSGQVAYWKLNANGTLLSDEQNIGWGYVGGANFTISSAWTLSAIQENVAGNSNNEDLIWQNQASGRIAYWRLNDNGTLKNKTENDGWGYVGGTLTLDSNWSLKGLEKNQKD